MKKNMNDLCGNEIFILLRLYLLLLSKTFVTSPSSPTSSAAPEVCGMPACVQKLRNSTVSFFLSFFCVLSGAHPCMMFQLTSKASLWLD